MVIGYENRHILSLPLLVSLVTLDQSIAFVDDATRVASDFVTDLVPASLMRTYGRCWCIKQSSPAAKSPSHTTFTTRLRPATEKWANRRKNIRLVSEVVRLVAEVVGDRKGQISRNKVDGHVQNLKPAIPNRKWSHD